MSDVSRYAFINAKLRARIGDLHTHALVENMIKAPNLAEAVATLSGTRHDCLFRAYEETGDLQMVELALFEEEVGYHKELLKYLDSRTGKFVNVLLEKIEEANLKNAVRLWFSASVMKHPISYRSAYIDKDVIVNDIDYTKMINALTWDDLVKATEGTPYHEVYSHFTAESISSQGLFHIENMVDHLWYRRLFESFDDLSRKDEEVARSIYLVDVDIKNILSIIRYGLYYDFKKEQMGEIFIPYGDVYRLLKEDLDDGQLEVNSARKIIGRLYPEAEDILEKMDMIAHPDISKSDMATYTLRFEHYLNDRRNREFTGILSGDPFTVGTMLAYIFLRKAEDNMIKGILSAKYYHWDEERIRRELN